VTTTSSFDVFGEATQSGSVSTVYDGLGRVATRDGVVFGYSGLGQDVINDGSTVFGRSLLGGPVSSKTAVSGSLRWLVGDQHGDVVGMVMPATGAMSSTVGFDPWGVVAGRSGVGLSVAGFQGDWTDPVSGVVDMEARGYSPLLGTFTSRDSVSGSVSSPLSMNRFGYGEGDPVNHSDPSGHYADGISPSQQAKMRQESLLDFFYTVEAQKSRDAFDRIARPGAPDVNGSEDAYWAAVNANRMYKAMQLDVWFRLVAVGQGDPSAYGSNQKDREQAIADNDKAYVFLAAVAWAQAHPAPVVVPAPQNPPQPTADDAVQSAAARLYQLVRQCQARHDLSLPILDQPGARQYMIALGCPRELYYPPALAEDWFGAIVDFVSDNWATGVVGLVGGAFCVSSIVASAGVTSGCLGVVGAATSAMAQYQATGEVDFEKAIQDGGIVAFSVDGLPFGGGRPPVQATTIGKIDEMLDDLARGKNSGVLTVSSPQELDAVYAHFANGGKVVEVGTYQGRVVQLPDGTRIGLRPDSKSGGATIDVWRAGETHTYQKVHIAK
jgi:RHS repeat-associated protein